jgi:hypothetical protein
MRFYKTFGTLLFLKSKKNKLDKKKIGSNTKISEKDMDRIPAKKKMG